MQCIFLTSVFDGNILPQQKLIQSSLNLINMNLQKIGKSEQLENVFRQELPTSILGQGQPQFSKFSIIQKSYTGEVLQTQWRV